MLSSCLFELHLLTLQYVSLFFITWQQLVRFNLKNFILIYGCIEITFLFVRLYTDLSPSFLPSFFLPSLASFLPPTYSNSIFIPPSVPLLSFLPSLAFFLDFLLFLLSPFFPICLLSSPLPFLFALPFVFFLSNPLISHFFSTPHSHQFSLILIILRPAVSGNPWAFTYYSPRGICYDSRMGKGTGRGQST